MALIYFYDTTELDKQHISEVLAGTDHHWEYTDDKIVLDNCHPDAEVISVFVTSTVTREMIESMPKLRLIACRSTGFNNVDMDAAAERDIAVVNVPTYGEDTVAEYAFLLLMALMRKLPDVLKVSKERVRPQDITGRELANKTFGVIGTGHIGVKALKIAKGLSMQTIAFDSCGRPELQEEYGFKYVSLDELLAQADVISLHVPYLPSTFHIINRDTLGRMKQGAILVNTARGELVDTDALIESLDDGHIGGAAIDVIEGEALLNYDEETALLRSTAIPEKMLRHSIQISALQKMPNVIISPHNAFNTIEAIQRINQTTAQNIIDFWYGNIPNKVALDKKSYGKLLVVRHAESEWNAAGKWTGITDVDLSDKGFREASMFGQALKKLDIPIDIAYCSEQIRTRETLESMLNAAQQFDVKVAAAKALNERDYGQYTGKNKWEVQKLIGEQAFDAIRRGWDVPVPGGETLKDVYERVTPFYTETILPQLQHGKNVMIVAHGNSIRALVKYLESMGDADVAHLEMPFGQINVYDVAPTGLCATSSVVKIETTPPAA